MYNTSKKNTILLKKMFVYLLLYMFVPANLRNDCSDLDGTSLVDNYYKYSRFLLTVFPKSVSLFYASEAASSS